MDHQSWIWRQKSSEKSRCETESSGGSMSSHSERFSDDQSCESHEVTSNAKEEEEAVEDVVKTLSQKLSEALMKISIKEDLVKEHSKVAEEAVEGLEKAEKEALALRRQVEVLTLRNSTLQDRVCHLDGALKECLRQLRQTRDEKDEKKKTSEWQRQTAKAELEKQLSDLRSQLQSAKKSVNVKMVEKENSALKLELASMAEELEMRFIERELSKQAADESEKKAAKLEAECCKLNAALRKALATNDKKSSRHIPSNVESDAINLMDDFLEMERLVALRKSAPRDSSRNQISQVEEILKRVEMEKRKVEIALNERENELKEAETKLVKMEALLINAKETTEKELESVKAIVNVLQESVKKSKQELDIECNGRKEAESRLEDAYTKKNEAGSRLNTLEAELESLIPKVNLLETEVEKERALSGKFRARCHELEAELESLIPKVDSLETEVEKERTKRALAGARCRELEAELECLIPKVDFLETEVEKERALSKKWGVKSQELESSEISRLQRENQYPKPAILNAELSTKQDTELASARCKFADCQNTIASLSDQLKTLATLEDFLIDTNEFSRRI
ncbi:putative filament-like plant protein [Helianthus annuus]|uniref:Putative filament-like plant protein n=1 Tax=Helianthus annuus TaxID=4232 RepID=A0A251T5X9_HELAN|nr:putative filament-like plant protein [Helianthus annuus]KAJ0494458.1 putative filament-like plant protein [Helianthus annuus]KAJ0506216.1 putative filament-like plant protein [Helianthus annuus]KAJ0675887.1 putative filament-like plant protein [Helianthus annuus]KAJ0679137.1 putative filament-like plant protein [Helianthus annuus]